MKKIPCHKSVPIEFWKDQQMLYMSTRVHCIEGNKTYMRLILTYFHHWPEIKKSMHYNNLQILTILMREGINANFLAKNRVEICICGWSKIFTREK